MSDKHRQISGNSDRQTAAREISPLLQDYIRIIVEESFYAKDAHFIKCTNHLDEVAWLTEFEINQQHEFFPADETFIQRLSHKISRWRNRRWFQVPGAAQYRQKLTEEICIEKIRRLEKLEEIVSRQELKTGQEPVQKTLSSVRPGPGCKLYQNYHGERKWMTEDEFENQDEYGIEILSPKRKLFRFSAWSGALILIGLVFYLIIMKFNGSGAGGSLRILTDDHRGQLYINENLFLGFLPGQSIFLPEGEYKITFRKAGYDTKPLFYKITINDDDKLDINFLLQQKETASQSLVKILSVHDDARVFIDNEFYGIVQNSGRLFLKPGKHRISLKKDHFNVMPPVSEVSLIEGDSLELSFSFTPKTRTVIKSKTYIDGLVEVSSNVHGAKIFFDGEDTGLETDYILTKVSAGSHVISVEKEGYKSYPREKVVEISPDDRSIKVNFNLSRLSHPVSITTQPVRGKIFIDKREVGVGNWSGSLIYGEHEIQFGRVNYYTSPESRIIMINEESQNDFTFNYDLSFSLLFSPAGIQPPNTDGSFLMGYVTNPNTFHAIPASGPDITNTPVISEKVWRLGYASSFKSPPDCDAIKFMFNLPADIEIDPQIRLKIWGYRTEEKYPQALQASSGIDIYINGKLLKSDYHPQFLLQEAGENFFEQFPLGGFLSHGRNTIQISTSKNNTTFFILWKLSVE